MRCPTGNWFVAGAIGALFGIDQISKYWVQTNLTIYSSRDVIPSFFQLSHYVNQGAMGGIGQRSPLTIPLLVVGGVVVFVLLLMLYHQYTRWVRPSWRMQLFVALSIAPILSHTLDRLRQGYVVDFIHLKGLPVFNLADLLPHAAVVLLAIEVVSHLLARRRAGTFRRSPADAVAAN